MDEEQKFQQMIAKGERFSVAHYFVKNVLKLTNEEEMTKAFAKIDINKAYIDNKIMGVNKQLNPKNRLETFNLIKKAILIQLWEEELGDNLTDLLEDTVSEKHEEKLQINSDSYIDEEQKVQQMVAKDFDPPPHY